ncbi:hypothetical protein Shyhy02_43010 [Streptomyces hygroscopicus subsp. hygroscopicus]|nr:hypothetical protein Shyhy02_43010 [Streptomyces hygroscopicus subsp. hygroscopicus]
MLGARFVVVCLLGGDPGTYQARASKNTEVGLAVSAQPLPAHVRGRDPVLPVAGAVDGQHSTGMRSGARIIQ